MEKLELTSQICSIIYYSRIITAKTSLFIFPLFSTRYSISFVRVSNIDLPLSIDSIGDCRVFPNVGRLFTLHPIEGCLDGCQFLAIAMNSSHIRLCHSNGLFCWVKLGVQSPFFFSVHFLTTCCVSGTLLPEFSRPHKDKLDIDCAVKKLIAWWGKLSLHK